MKFFKTYYTQVFLFYYITKYFRTPSSNFFLSFFFRSLDPARESSGSGEGRSGAAGRRRANQGGEHFEGKPLDKEPGRERQQQLCGEAEVGRRRDLQELRQGLGRQAAAEVHQRHSEKRVSQEVHGQIREVNILC